MRIAAQKLTWFNKIKGLMFKNKIEPIFFKERFGIHTFFVKHPIDIALTDKNFKVIKTKSNLKPWKMYVWGFNSRFVFELPQGHIKEKKISVGSKIQVAK